MARINLYAQNRHILIIDGVQIKGFAEGDWLSVAVKGGGAQISTGGDGPAMNLAVQQGGEITVSLLPTSPELGTMYELRKAQQANPRMFGIQLVSGVEEIITATGCAFGDLASFSSGSDKMSQRQFTFQCLSIDMDTSAVTPITDTLVGGLL